MTNLTEVIKQKFNTQKTEGKYPVTCPHCNKKIDFEFRHTQTTDVSTELVKLEKGE
jgi:DNA-directed RNA polymerase subunit RPC12/RpoP